MWLMARASVRETPFTTYLLCHLWLTQNHKNVSASEKQEEETLEKPKKGGFLSFCSQVDSKRLRYATG